MDRPEDTTTRGSRPGAPRPGATNRAIAGLVVAAFAAGAIGAASFRSAGRDEHVGGAPADVLPALHWKLPVAFGTHLPVIGESMLAAAERVFESSGGRMRLELFEPGLLVGTFEIVDAVRAGKVESGMTWLGYDQGKIPSSVLFGAVPFGMQPWEFMAWWFEGGGRGLAEEIYARHGVHPLLCGIIGPETAGWFREPIESAEDLVGLKIRFAGIGGRVLQELGASVTVMPAAEIFPALEKGAIDATEFSLPIVDAKLGFDRIAKNNYFPGWHQPFTSFHLIVGRERWLALPEAARALFDSACTANVARTLSLAEAVQGPVLEDMAARGVATRHLPDDVLADLRAATQRVLEREAGEDEDFRRVLDSQRRFSGTYASWRQLAYPVVEERDDPAAGD